MVPTALTPNSEMLLAEGEPSATLRSDLKSVIGNGMVRTTCQTPALSRRSEAFTADSPVRSKLTAVAALVSELLRCPASADEGAAVVWRGPMVMSALNQFLREVEWGELDVLVVDMPPGTGDAQLTMAQNVPLSGAVIVSTPQDLSLIDARRGMAMFRQVNVPLIGVVENMSYFICPHCGGRSDIFAHGGARHEAETHGAPFLGEIPLDIVIRETSDGGAPVVVSAPDGPQAQAFLAVAERVRAELFDAGKPVRAAPRIFMS